MQKRPGQKSSHLRKIRTNLGYCHFTVDDAHPYSNSAKATLLQLAIEGSFILLRYSIHFFHKHLDVFGIILIFRDFITFFLKAISSLKEMGPNL